ncbi:MAG: ACP S-malonyltransferase [Anaerolineales bacterium]|nr:ACP S-malonyltransferase [Anaerolineales bacterium]
MTLDPKISAFLFPGQGSQTVGMGHDLASSHPIARQTFAQADSLLGFPLTNLMWEGPEAELNNTLNTQPALYVHSVAALRVLSALVPDLKPVAVAGHSLGQFSALTAAGALPFEAGLRLVRRRGELMQAAGQANPGGMAAILGLDIPTLEDICARASTTGATVQVANDNCPGQVVLSGTRAAVERAVVLAKEAGARRSVQLAVSVAPHSALMASAQDEFAAAVAAAGIEIPAVPVVCNVCARPLESVAEIRTNLVAQLTSRVRWTESLEWLGARGVTTFLEVGPGTVLAGLVRRTLPDSVTLPFGAPPDFAAVVGG